MINALHLLWIAPLSAFAGYMACAILSIGKESRERREPHDE